MDPILINSDIFTSQVLLQHIDYLQSRTLGRYLVIILYIFLLILAHLCEQCASFELEGNSSLVLSFEVYFDEVWLYELIWIMSLHKNNIQL